MELLGYTVDFERKIVVSNAKDRPKSNFFKSKIYRIVSLAGKIELEISPLI